MKTVAQISKEITTTVRELASGRFEIVCTHISGESITSSCGSNHAAIKPRVIHSTLVSRIANMIEAE